MMSETNEFLLSLIRNAVNSSNSIIVPDSLNWGEVRDVASLQGVNGLCSSLLKGMDVPFEEKMQWIGHVMTYEHYFNRYCKALEHLAKFYAENGIRMMLLKGYDMSLNWPVAGHRPMGDIDVYLRPAKQRPSKSPLKQRPSKSPLKQRPSKSPLKQRPSKSPLKQRPSKSPLKGDFLEREEVPVWRVGDMLVEKCLGVKVSDSHEHHTTFVFKDFLVENHYDIINTKVMSDSMELERWFKQEAEKSTPHRLGEATIYLPSAQLNAIFLMRHLGAHFSGSEATLRQVLDWAFFMQKHSEEVNWQEALLMLEKIGLLRFFHQVNAICVDYLGFDENVFPAIHRENSLESRILNDIMQPERIEIDRNRSTLYVVWQKVRRFHANSWKRRLVYNDSLFRQFFMGSLSHLRRIESIKD